MAARRTEKLAPGLSFETKCEQSEFELETGAQTGLTTAGANPGLVIGDVLRLICVELPSQAAPIRIILHLNHFGFVLELKEAWIRSGSAHASPLIWSGKLIVGENPSLFVFARNDTGGTVTVRTHHTVDRVID